jgi:hypothetical protein
MRNLPWRAAQAFALVVLLVWAGAFSLYVFPGRDERPPATVGSQVVPTPTRCERFWQLMADADTDQAINALLLYHPDRDCLR